MTWLVSNRAGMLNADHVLRMHVEGRRIIVTFVDVERASIVLQYPTIDDAHRMMGVIRDALGVAYWVPVGDMETLV